MSRAHSKSEYKRLKAGGKEIEPPYQGLPLTPEFEEVLKDCGIVVSISDETTDRELDDIEEEYEEEPESQSSKHCDAGWMNDVRFGDY